MAGCGPSKARGRPTSVCRMKVSQLAAAAGVSPHTVRFYVRAGLLEPERHPVSRYALFDAAALERLRFIRRTQRLGFALDEIRTILAMARHGDSPCPVVRDIVRQRSEATLATIAELTTAHREMAAALARWQDMPDSVPSGTQVCALIEALIQDEAQRI